MFIAHLPSGYLLARAALARARVAGIDRRALLAAALTGSVCPDVDLLYNLLVDDRAVHHHRYLTHLPFAWLVLAAVVVSGLRLLRKERALALARVFLAGVAIHLCLDTVVGDIAWGWPLDDTFVHLVEVPARYDWYVWSFVLHWTFALELALVGTAGYVGWARSLAKRSS